MQRLLQEHYHHYVRRLSHALLACPSLGDRDRRGALLRDLPDDIRRQLDNNLSTSMLIIQDLVKTCANRERGEDALFQTLNNHEMDSLTFQQVQREWQTIKQEMDEQDRLIAWAKASEAPFVELKRRFEAVVPKDYAAIPRSVETLIKALWEVPAGHTPLVTFMQGLTTIPQLPDPVRNAISAWIAAAEWNDSLRLAAIEDQEAESVETRLIITIEFSKQDLTKRQISFRRSDGSLRKTVESEGNKLEHVISKEIDHWTLIYETVTAIEFYLPKALLTVPVNSWWFKSGSLEQRFIERYQITKSILERQEARAFRNQLAGIAADSEKEKLLQLLEVNPLKKELVRRSIDWKNRWQRLHNHTPVLFRAITQALEPDDLLQPIDGTAFILLTFNPPDLDSINLDDPIGQLMITGVPILAWIQATDENPDLSAYARKRLFEAHCDCCIHSANDLIQLMHVVCRETAGTAVQRQISQNLNLIVDNPESKLPADFIRVTMS